MRLDIEEKFNRAHLFCPLSALEDFNRLRYRVKTVKHAGFGGKPVHLILGHSQLIPVDPVFSFNEIGFNNILIHIFRKHLRQHSPIDFCPPVRIEDPL